MQRSWPDVTTGIQEHLPLHDPLNALRSLAALPLPSSAHAVLFLIASDELMESMISRHFVAAVLAVLFACAASSGCGHVAQDFRAGRPRATKQSDGSTKQPYQTYPICMDGRPSVTPCPLQGPYDTCCASQNGVSRDAWGNAVVD